MFRACVDKYLSNEIKPSPCVFICTFAIWAALPEVTCAALRSLIRHYSYVRSHYLPAGEVESLCVASFRDVMGVECGAEWQ